MKRRTIYLTALVGTIGVVVAWPMISRAGYETAEYEVVESDGNIEIRRYPDLVLAATESAQDARDRDGSFMRLFRYISGANAEDQKIEMTTPVFMSGEAGESDASMGFVMPKKIATEGAPAPQSDRVKIRKRRGGRFAVIRFSGRISPDVASQQEAKLREWMKARGLRGDASAEVAGYDPPLTPPPLRRNEILIRLDEPARAPDTLAGTDDDS